MSRCSQILPVSFNGRKTFCKLRNRHDQWELTTSNALLQIFWSVLYVLVGQGCLLWDAAWAQRWYRRGHRLACRWAESSEVGYFNKLCGWTKHNNEDINAALFCRFGYFGQEEKAAVRLFLCNVSGCLTNCQIYTSVSGEDLVAINARDVAGIQMLQREDIEVQSCRLAQIMGQSTYTL